MIDYQVLDLPLLVSDENKAIIDDAFTNIPETADVINSYHNLVCFIETAESFLKNQLSDSDQETTTITSTEDFKIKISEPFVATQYWIHEVDLSHKQGKWHIINIRCEQVSKQSMAERMRRLLD